MACIFGHLTNDQSISYIQKVNNYEKDKLKDMSKTELEKLLIEVEMNKYGTESKLPDEFYNKQNKYEERLIKLIKEKDIKYSPSYSLINFNNNKNYGYNNNFYINYMCVD
jgi:hypothetical protein